MSQNLPNFEENGNHFDKDSSLKNDNKLSFKDLIRFPNKTMERCRKREEEVEIRQTKISQLIQLTLNEEEKLQNAINQLNSEGLTLQSSKRKREEEEENELNEDQLMIQILLRERNLLLRRLREK
eukprot:TRINITY_DN4607_c0_g1_i1.p1 TRINITY_DN4607_c0_g1~~TRINITY_DN4607_c0_g1_i1.p1  ORF type:complete len:125 (-),score=66.63 TRINITY_DN4607_c0_g1_i1:198-572(-)